MKKHLLTAVLMTAVTTILLGLVYPMVVTGLAQVMFRDKANGQILYRDGQAVGSHILGQPFTGDAYFHSRPSAAGNGYDAANSGATNLGPTNSKLIDQVAQRVKDEQTGTQQVPIDLVTASGSGLDPHITPAAAEYQIARVARARGMSESSLRSMVSQHTEGRQWGFLGEARVNVLELNLELDRSSTPKTIR